MLNRFVSGALLVCAIVLAVRGSIVAQSPAPPASDLSALKYRYIGPVGNRVIAVAGVPGDPNTYYAGAASGGIWKTDRWRRSLGAASSTTSRSQSIGALAVAPVDPNIVWAGTGEPFIRSNISIGERHLQVDRRRARRGRTWVSSRRAASRA